VQVAVRYISAAAAARIGGDLYELVATDGPIRIIIADVQDKVLPAVQTAAVVLGHSAMITGERAWFADPPETEIRATEQGRGQAERQTSMTPWNAYTPTFSGTPVANCTTTPPPRWSPANSADNVA
jgi:hypothetical protein